jgi:hypothetical protein
MAEQLIPPSRRGDFLTPGGELTFRFLKWVEAVNRQTNTSSENIESNEETLTSTGSRVSRNAARINSLELKEFEIRQVTSSVTTEENQILICKNVGSIDVTLDPQAIEEDEVHIKRRGAKIEVIGPIDGFTNRTINVKNYSMHLVFDGTDWSEI